MQVWKHIGFVALSLVVSGCLCGPALAKDEPKWIEVHTAHFSVITDGGEKRGREVALRMEQMRAVFGELLHKDKLHMSIPVTVIALKSDKQFGVVAPTKFNMTGGFYVPGYDRIYVVLNLFEDQPWRAIAHAMGHYFVNFNYPPAQGGLMKGWRNILDRSRSAKRSTLEAIRSWRRNGMRTSSTRCGGMRAFRSR